MMPHRSEKQKMLAGELYVASDPELQHDMAQCARWLARYNNANATLPERLGAVGENTCIRPPFRCDYGYNLFLGNNVFFNFNCIVLDVVPIRIGDGTQIGPGVQILAADHPRDPALRQKMLEFGRPVTIGRNVWTVAAPSSCRGSRSGMMPLSGRAVSSPMMWPLAQPWPAIRGGLCICDHNLGKQIHP
ncbi:maltose acetyltransferase domain-containing protein [Komagataeibacter europaeus]|nr:Maltose O-acetyltransferase [Komagataeibacter europaeus]